MTRSSRRPLLLLALTLAALVVLLVAVWPRGADPALPPPLQRVSPLPGDTVARQTAVELDLPAGYEVRFHVDGRAVPNDEVSVVESTGRWRWQPGSGRSLEQWEGGEHTVRVEWDRAVGRPDPGSFEWAFRAH